MGSFEYLITISEMFIQSIFFYLTKRLLITFIQISIQHYNSNFVDLGEQ